VLMTRGLAAVEEGGRKKVELTKKGCKNEANRKRKKIRKLDARESRRLKRSAE